MTAVYLLNRSPTKSIIGKTPYEAWYKRKPSVHHLRTFGCVAHVKTMHPHLLKLEDRSTAMVFIGYEPGSKAYRCYDPNSQRLHSSRDIVFEEDKCWNWDTDSVQEKTPVSLGETFTIICKDLDVSGGVLDRSIAESNEEAPKSPNLQISSPGTPQSQVYAISGFSQMLATDIDSSSEKPLRFRDLKDIHDDTEPVETQFSALCLLALEEPTSFEAAEKERCWRLAM